MKEGTWIANSVKLQLRLSLSAYTVCVQAKYLATLLGEDIKDFKLAI